MLDICHKAIDDSPFPVIFSIMKSTRLARTQNYDMSKIFKEKKEGNVSPKDLNLQLHQEKVTSYVTQDTIVCT